MEFHEKLQTLRKSRGMTQEELAEVLYVSRTAISKWESGRGYPSIDSLKEISSYFSVSIDQLLSGEKLIFIAEKENRSNIQNLCDLLFGFIDLFSIMLMFLPLYPKTVEGHVYCVNLWSYTETAVYNRTIYWILFTLLLVIGILRFFCVQMKREKGKRLITMGSMAAGTLTVIYLVMAREVYAAILAFVLLAIKTVVLSVRK